ncbi:hypothetical protein ILUMI_12036, partial [Ignelater luminosus]
GKRNKCLRRNFKQYNLEILNSYFRHKDINRYTWERPSIHQKSIIDYVIMRQKPKIVPQDVDLPYNQRHPIVRNLEQKETDGTVNGERLYLLKQESIHNLFQRRLEVELRNIQGNERIGEGYGNLKEITKTITREELGTEGKKTRQRVIRGNRHVFK